MIKAKLNNGDLVFGISDVNIDRLKKNQPIVINMKDVGLEERKIYIVYGESEEKLFLDMIDGIDLEKTKINL